MQRLLCFATTREDCGLVMQHLLCFATSQEGWAASWSVFEVHDQGRVWVDDGGRGGRVGERLGRGMARLMREVFSLPPDYITDEKTV